MTSPDADVRASLSAAQILTPGDWTELDLDPSTRHSSIRRAVRRAVQRDPGLERNAVRLIAMLDNVGRRAHDNGAFYCASLVLDGGGAGILVATVLLQISAVAAPPPPSSMSASEMCAGFAAAISHDPDWAGAEVTVVHLPFVGAAVRTRVVAAGLCLQYLVPVPSSSDQLLLTFSCPCPPYVETMTELFDAMGSSLTLLYEDRGHADAV
jgi:hypothetical protein